MLVKYKKIKIVLTSRANGFLAFKCSLVLTNEYSQILAPCTITHLTWLAVLQLFQVPTIIHTLYQSTILYAIAILQPSLCHSLKTNLSSDSGHVILTNTQVPILQSEYQILAEY